MGKTPCIEEDDLIPAWAFGLVVRQIRDAICLQDIRGHVEWMNPACETMFGWSLKNLRGRKAMEFISLPGNRRLGLESQNFRYDLDSSIFMRNVISEFQRRDGSRFCVQQNFSVLHLGPDPDQIKIVITCRDVSKEMSIDRRLQQVHSNLEYSANHDALTNLANRKKLDTFLQSAPARKALDARRIGVLQVDINGFKTINDTLGHAAGDAVLCHVAKTLRGHCGFSDLACRHGGDEFLLVCMGCESSDALIERAKAIIEDLSAPIPWEDGDISIKVSIGASYAGQNCRTGEELIQKADKALYNLKINGHEDVVLYTHEMGEKYRARIKQMGELRVALAEDQFEVFLQPQFSLTHNRVSGCEALIRWNHPTDGLLAPGLFLPAVDAAGLASDVDYVAMNKALDALVRLRDEGFENMRMSINVSSAILGDVNYPGLLDWGLQSRDIDPQNICIEILENTIMDGGGIKITTAIERLRRVGVQVALDDFGTGYAGLAHMSTFDVDEIKLDRSMVMRLSDDPRNRLIVSAILRLCHKLEIEVVAEGVETDDQLAVLRDAHCPIIQGYGVAKPMALDDLVTWMQTTTPQDVDLGLEIGTPAKILPMSAAGR